MTLNSTSDFHLRKVNLSIYICFAFWLVCVFVFFLVAAYDNHNDSEKLNHFNTLTHIRTRQFGQTADFRLQ